MKRKTLKNNLINYDFDKIKNILSKHSLQETVRAEEISEDVFTEIYKTLYNQIGDVIYDKK